MLRDVLAERISREGPMPFEAFMEACLYDPERGFFSTGPLRSARSGDFLTSPEVSPWFGRVLARAVAAERRRVDAGGFTIVDAGAGSGSLIGPLVAELDDVCAWAVDASPAARDALRRIPGVHVADSIVEVPAPFRGVIVANELLDNAPVALAVRSGGGWNELRVDWDGTDLIFVAWPARPDVAAWADGYAGEVLDGGIVEVQLAAAGWVAESLARMTAGALFVIDYGGTAEELAPRRSEGTLRTYRSHHLGPDPLAVPGETDVTVDVNFTAMVAAAQSAGAVVELARQDDFLTRWGLRQEVARLRSEELESARQGDAARRLELRSERIDAETLLHPRGLGDFRVMVARVAGR